LQQLFTRLLDAIFPARELLQVLANQAIHGCPVLGGVDPRSFQHLLLDRQRDILHGGKMVASLSDTAYV